MTERINSFCKSKRDFESVMKRPEKVIFESSEDLYILNKQFSQTFPEWKKMVSQFRQVKFDIDKVRRAKGKDEKNFCDEEFASLFSEMHLRNFLEKNGHFQDGIIPSGSTSQNYLFERSIDGRLHVYNRSKKQEICEYDAIAYFDNLPVLYEVKMSNHTRNGINESIESAISHNHVENIFKPLSEFFGMKEFGYSLVIPPEEIRPDSLTQRRFLNESGMIAPFCMKNQLYRGLAAKVREQYGI